MYKTFLYKVLTYLSPNFDKYISVKFSESKSLNIVDIGFYKGSFTRNIVSKVMKLNKNILIKVYSFDPNEKTNLSEFKKFHDRNKFEWDHSHKAIGEFTKKENFTILNAFPSSGSSIVNILEDSFWYKSRKFLIDPFGNKDLSTSTITVEVDTLDNLFHNEQDINLLKIDVEGFSFQVLKGAKEFLLNNSPILQVEVLSKKLEFDIRESEIIDFLDSIDYKLISKKKHYTTHIFSDVICVDYLFEK